MSGLLITFEQVKNSEEINTYIKQADLSLQALGFTEHSFVHVGRVSQTASRILQQLGYPPRDCELARIAGYVHDIGNVINRIDHAQSGAVMTFRILDKMGMDPSEVAQIICAVGNHDEKTAEPVNPIAAALILADKSDVRRSRVTHWDPFTVDIHDRVNYSVYHSNLELDSQAKTITLVLDIDTEICPVMDYFEIFLERMVLCRKAATFLQLTFKLSVNGQALL